MEQKIIYAGRAVPSECWYNKMAKIGRNDSCPCGSGIKYKKCCLKQKSVAQPVSPVQQLKISLLSEIEKVQRAAERNEETVRELGVFVFCTNSEGDAWLFEITDQDGVQLADKGTALEVPIDENPETIEINWSHTFTIRDRQLFLTTYSDQVEVCYDSMPTQRIHAAIRRIRKKYSEEQLNQVHVNPQEPEKVTS